MKRKFIINSAFSLAAALGLLALQVSPVSAMSLVKTNTATAGNAAGAGTGASAAITAAKTAADAKVDARIKSLNDLSARVGEMKRLSDSQKSSLSSSIQASISDMTSLKAKIDADTDAATVKTDAQSITKGYRIYILVIPQGRVEAAADRITDIVALMTNLQTKLQARITQAQTDGNDVTAANAAMADFQAKLTDANTQTQAALSLVANLQPDNGDQATVTANNQALKSAKAKIRAAMADLKTARQDIGKVVKMLQTFKASASVNANANANVNASAGTNSNY